MEDYEFVTERKQKRKVLDDEDRDGTAMDLISRLPDCIIHHILSFLSPKEISRCSILSKYWHQLWSSCPDYDLVVRYDDYEKYCHKLLAGNQVAKGACYLKSVDEFVQRCLQKNFHLNRFRMQISLPILELLAPYMDRWVGFAVERDAKEVDLDILSRFMYIVPRMVLFGKSITVLRLNRCKFETNCDIGLSLLRELQLRNVWFDELIFQKLTNNCPLIEDLSLQHCEGPDNIRFCSSLCQLRNVNIQWCYRTKIIEIEAPNVQSFSFGRFDFQPSCVINFTHCKALKKLVLEGADISGEQLEILISKLRSLEILELISCYNLRRIMIKNHTLRQLEINSWSKVLFVKIEAPNLLSIQQYSPNMPFPYINIPHLRQIEIGFQFRRTDRLWFGKLQDCLLKSSHSHNFKLVIYHPCKYMVVHEKLSDILLPALIYLEDLEPQMVISSMKFSDLTSNRLRLCTPKTLSLVYSHDKPMKFPRRFVYEKIKDGHQDPEHSIPTRDFWVPTGGFVESVYSQEAEDGLKLFLHSHSNIDYSVKYFMPCTSPLIMKQIAAQAGDNSSVRPALHRLGTKSTVISK